MQNQSLFGNFCHLCKYKSVGTSSRKVWNALTQNMKMFTCKVDSVAKDGQNKNEVALVESFYSVNYANVNYSIKKNCVFIWQETGRKSIDGLERLG